MSPCGDIQKIMEILTASKASKASKATSSKKSKTKTKKQGGGSYASDAVNGTLDPGAFERIGFLLSGGKCSCASGNKMFGGFGDSIPMGIPAANGDAFPSGLSASFTSSLAQPLSYHGIVDNAALFPNYLSSSFTPPLNNA